MSERYVLLERLYDGIVGSDPNDANFQRLLSALADGIPQAMLLRRRTVVPVVFSVASPDDWNYHGAAQMIGDSALPTMDGRVISFRTRVPWSPSGAARLRNVLISGLEGLTGGPIDFILNASSAQNMSGAVEVASGSFLLDMPLRQKTLRLPGPYALGDARYIDLRLSGLQYTSSPFTLASPMIHDWMVSGEVSIPLQE